MRGFWRRQGVIWGLVVLGQACAVGAAGARWVPAAAAERTSAQVRSAGMAQMAMPAAAQRAAGTVVLLHRKVVKVSSHNFAFAPAKLVISRGTRVVWTNTDSDPHTVDSTKNLWTSEALDTDGRFSRVFSKAGTFPYYCSIHPFMHGQIVVQK